MHFGATPYVIFCPGNEVGMKSSKTVLWMPFNKGNPGQEGQRAVVLSGHVRVPEKKASRSAQTRCWCWVWSQNTPNGVLFRKLVMPMPTADILSSIEAVPKANCPLSTTLSVNHGLTRANTKHDQKLSKITVTRVE